MKNNSYSAFISYRHLEPDSAWADELYQFLINYELPENLKRKYKNSGQKTEIRPVFYDKNRLDAGEILTTTIKDACKIAVNIVIICSDNSITNNEEGRNWVNEESSFYISVHDDWIQRKKIIPLVVNYKNVAKDVLPTPLKDSDIVYIDAKNKQKKRIFIDIAASILKLPSQELWEYSKANKISIIKDKIISFFFYFISLIFIICIAIHVFGYNIISVAQLAQKNIFPTSYSEAIFTAIENNDLQTLEILCNVYRGDNTKSDCIFTEYQHTGETPLMRASAQLNNKAVALILESAKYKYGSNQLITFIRRWDDKRNTALKYAIENLDIDNPNTAISTIPTIQTLFSYDNDRLGEEYIHETKIVFNTIFDTNNLDLIELVVEHFINNGGITFVSKCIPYDKILTKTDESIINFLIANNLYIDTNQCNFEIDNKGHRNTISSNKEGRPKQNYYTPPNLSNNVSMSTQVNREYITLLSDYNLLKAQYEDILNKQAQYEDILNKEPK